MRLRRLEFLPSHLCGRGSSHLGLVWLFEKKLYETEIKKYLGNWDFSWGSDSESRYVLPSQFILYTFRLAINVFRFILVKMVQKGVFPSPHPHTPPLFQAHELLLFHTPHISLIDSEFCIKWQSLKQISIWNCHNNGSPHKFKTYPSSVRW